MAAVALQPVGRTPRRQAPKQRRRVEAQHVAAVEPMWHVSACYGPSPLLSFLVVFLGVPKARREAVRHFVGSAGACQPLRQVQRWLRSGYGSVQTWLNVFTARAWHRR